MGEALVEFLNSARRPRLHRSSVMLLLTLDLKGQNIDSEGPVSVEEHRGPPPPALRPVHPWTPPAPGKLLELGFFIGVSRGDEALELGWF